MFKEAAQYNHILAEKMTIFNPNISWAEVLKKGEGKTDEQILRNLIMPKLWVNKPHGEDLDDRLTAYYFMHFTRLFKKYENIKKIYIMDDISSPIEELNHLLEQKVSILRRFLNIYQIKILRSPTDEDYTFPLSYIVSGGELKGHIVKDDDLWSHVISSPVVNRILISIKLMQLGVSIENILANVKNFYFI